MAASAFLLIAVFLVVLFALALPLGRMLARLIDGEPLLLCAVSKMAYGAAAGSFRKK